MLLQVKGMTGAFDKLVRKPEFGLLVIRVSVGILMCLNGFNKFSGGLERLKGVGAAIENIGIPAGHPALAITFGIFAAGSQLIGGALLALGLWARVAALCICLTMSVAAVTVFGRVGAGLSDWGHPLLFALMTFGLIWTGPGRISVDKD